MNPDQIRKSSLAVAVALVTSATAVAQEPLPPPAQATLMNQVTVTATRTERALDDVASSVSVVTAADAEKNLARDIRDLVKYEPGITVSSDSRFGLGGFNIRGMDENRVKISVDGVSQAKAYGYDRSLQSQRNFFDIESMKQLEVVKGPASSVHGSDAIGGVAAFITKDPADFLEANGDDTYLSLKGGYNSSDSSLAETFTIANRTGDLESLLIYTHRDGKETETYGGRGGIGESREQADPLDYSGDSVLGKLQYQVNETNRVGLTAEWQKTESQTELLSQDGEIIEQCVMGVCHQRIYSDMSAEDQSERTRFGFFHDYDRGNAVFDNLKWSLNWQESVSKQKTWDNFVGKVAGLGIVTNDDYRLKDYRYSEDSVQLEATFNKSLMLANTEHYLTYGFNVEDKTYENHNQTHIKDNQGTDPDEFEQEAWMPEVNFRQYGLFLQDEIGLMDSRLTITPSVRYDNFSEDIKADNNYQGDLTQFKNDTYDSLTGRLGAVYDINDTWSTYAQFSQGFTAPDMFAKYFTYKMGHTVEVLANPDLKPEESDSFEIGLRADYEFGGMELTAFYNEYENFIEEGCVGDQPCSTSGGTFKYQNLSEATVKGVEFKAMLWLDELAPVPLGTRLNTAVAWAEGRGTKPGENGKVFEDEPLNTIAPLTAVLGLGYDAPSEQWGGEVILTLVAAKDSDDISNVNDISMGGDLGEDKFAPPGYGIVDMTAYYQPMKNLTINAGIFNITDKKYWVWDDVRNITVADQGLNRYTQPGRNYSVSVKWEI